MKKILLIYYLRFLITTFFLTNYSQCANQQ